jgi:hypothetical protein
MKRSAHAKLHPGQLEKILPYIACKDRIAIAYYGARETMEPDNCFEEGLSYRGRSVGMTERYEVRMFGKTIHHRQNHALAIDTG